MIQTSNSPFTIYANSWCCDCVRVRDWLNKHNLQLGRDYQEIDINESAEAAELVEKLNDGFRSVPTLVWPDGRILTEPSNQELAAHFGLNS